MSTPAASHFSTRDLIGPTLIFLAAFLLAVTVAAPTFLVDKFRKVSLDTDVTVVATSAPGTKFLDACALDAPVALVRTGDLLTGQRVVAVRPADADRVTLQAGTSVRVAGGKAAEDCDNPTVTAFKDRVTLDRRSAAPIANPVSAVQYDSNRAPVPLPQRAGVTYLFPRDPASGLSFYDVATRRSVPLRAAGDANVNGLDAVRFTADIPDTDLSTQYGVDNRPEPGTLITRPARWFGSIDGVAPSTPLTAALHRSGQWSLSVDPKTGIIIDADFTIAQEYRIVNPGTNAALSGLRLPSLVASFSYDDTSQKELTDTARAQSRPQIIWGRIVPLIAGMLGVIALVAGVVLLRRGSRRPVNRARSLRSRRPASKGDPVRERRDGGSYRGDGDETGDAVGDEQDRDGLAEDHQPRDQ
ncbi:DUF3068 domain-containing protein [Gordonia effusa]|uniref:DUF3068 domain-containing protein n=1 Tax=Gordonia effusa TaxID=263908 RepID=UPI000A044FC5|nr:DUF3068 domain-containing protein [Gordonia effusa]